MRKNNQLIYFTLLLIALLRILTLNFGLVYASESKLENSKEDYIEFKRFPLIFKSNGIDGALILMRDKRTADISTALEESETFRNAQLCIVDKNGKTIETCQLKKPIANLETKQLISDMAVSYIITLDYNIGIGSYAGLGSEFLDVINGKLKWISAIDSKTSESKNIQVAFTLKTAWKFVPLGQNFDVLQVLCRPSFEGKNDQIFNIIYERYHYNGKDWIKYSKVEKGFWENDSDFPYETLFPSEGE